MLGERPPTRGQLASLLFAEADDPLRALRWSLSEIRRCLGDDGTLDGDPVVLRLPPGRGRRRDRPQRTGRGPPPSTCPASARTCSTGLTIHGAPAFESWLLSERRRVAADGRGDPARGRARLDVPRRPRRRLAPTRVRADRDEPARREPPGAADPALPAGRRRRRGPDGSSPPASSCSTRELGVPPGVAVERGIAGEHGAERRHRRPTTPRSRPSSRPARPRSPAGAIEAGVESLRTAVRLADRRRGRPAARRLPAGAGRGADPFARRPRRGGLATLHDADRIALAAATAASVARARAELGYVDFLRGPLRPGRGVAHRRARVRRRIAARSRPRPRPTWVRWRATGPTIGPRGRRCWSEAIGLVPRRPAISRREAYALSMLGRVRLLRGDLDAAAEQLDASIALAERDHWLSFLPWPQALRGEVAAGAAATRAARPRLLRAGLRPGLPARRSRAGRGCPPAASRWSPTRRGRHRRGRSRSWPTPGAVEPARRPVRLARRVHPRRPVRRSAGGTATRTPRRWVEAHARSRVPDRHARADRPVAAARRGARQRGRRRGGRACSPPTSTTPR